MAVPGSSKVYYGGTIAYNTKRSGKLLCGDARLHNRLLNIPSDVDTTGVIGLEMQKQDLSEEAKKYIQAKVHSTRETALSYCAHMQTDFGER